MMLCDRQLHLWWADLNPFMPQLAKLRSYLSVDELERSQRFHFDEHRRYFILARGVLRSLLAQYLNCHPSDLQFTYSQRGKPALALPQSELNFNVSHSKNYALYGFALNAPLGVDIEAIRPLTDLEGLAKRFFLPSEYQHIQQTPIAQQPYTFFRYWTYKEAYLKAMGEGLAGLEQAEIQLTETGAQVSDRAWSLYPLSPPPGTVAAVAVEGQNWQVVLEQLTINNGYL
ncbi:4'-phosphopantetheinyl transferase superfamily protein [Roseofilum sp. BLCC_M154]|uniref:4'-phosphopantetheinyl transferase superfamily protein n=1 Tax=Roseofilum acuticapitatum BLCC-M154 TaxID=3022444 RepID=A0ABT7AS23_9CYAN|nr:4'-phosphopantetheinyl transferase superfamily protein [Roseofilum acuticapitatum]MDJ1169705.1 4'-phosphopantetheinyl transferase superfamily protein [Roseofilum acuticapitatum BLCC-M154]